MSDLIIYKDLLIDLFNLSDADIHSIRHENQNGKTLIFVTLVSHPFDCPSWLLFTVSQNLSSGKLKKLFFV